MSDLKKALDSVGLVGFGVTSLEEGDCPRGQKQFAGAWALMIGNAGGSLWQHFANSAEYKDGKANPLDRWSSRVIGNVADQHHCAAVFPFEKPWWPFQRLAARACGLKPSPLGLLIHPNYGLWHAFRGMLVATDANVFEPFRFVAQTHPCDMCIDKPCLHACPVNAFSVESSFDVGACDGHLAAGNEPRCMAWGCKARLACPVGKNYAYPPEQQQFHMSAFARR